MNNLNYSYHEAGIPHQLEMIFVENPDEKGFWFGEETRRIGMRVRDFYIAALPVTHALWNHIMGTPTKPGLTHANDEPAIYVSWNDVSQPGGFLDRINQSNILTELKKQVPGDIDISFRLPSETEWEYAARGGKAWRENFLFSGSDNMGDVAWYKQNSDRHTHPVGQKSPNQIGIYDMSGNVWEWCRDTHTYNTDLIPRDGSPYEGDGKTRILRGGCHHNGGIHCTVFKRYEIFPDANDECIGFRLVLDITTK